MIRIGICDDNAVLLNNLSKIVVDAFHSYTSDFEVFSYTSGSLLLNAHNQEAFDIISLILICQKLQDLMLPKC